MRRLPSLRPGLVTILLVFFVAVSDPRAENIDPGNDGSQYAYGENIGWLNTQPLGPGGWGVQVDDFELTGWMWGENVGWASLSCQNTLTCGVVEYGVSNPNHNSRFVV